MDTQRILFALFLGLSVTAVLAASALPLGAATPDGGPSRGRFGVSLGALALGLGWLVAAVVLASQRRAMGAVEMSATVLLAVGLTALAPVRRVLAGLNRAPRALPGLLRGLGLARVLAGASGWLPWWFVGLATGVDLAALAATAWALRSGSRRAAWALTAVSVLGGVAVSATAAVGVRPLPSWELLAATFTTPYFAMLSLWVLPAPQSEGRAAQGAPDV